jgi:hypothetical protein
LLLPSGQEPVVVNLDIRWSRKPEEVHWGGQHLIRAEEMSKADRRPHDMRRRPQDGGVDRTPADLGMKFWGEAGVDALRNTRHQPARSCGWTSLRSAHAEDLGERLRPAWSISSAPHRGAAQPCCLERMLFHRG